MAVSTVAARSNHFDADFAALFGLWTVRPRVAVATPLWSLISSCVYEDSRNPYNWTFKDMLVAESLLNILTVPFAVHFLGQRNGTSSACECNPNNSSNACPILGVKVFYDCMLAVSFIGAASFFLLICWLLLHWVGESKKGKGEYHDLQNREYRSVSGTLNFLLFGFGSIIMFGACAAQWLVWSGKQAHPISHTQTLLADTKTENATFVANAGDSYCPGSLITIGVAWGVAFVVNGILRPIIGGSPQL
jgi:hypothetical protein